MTKLLDNLEPFYLGRRHAELGPVDVDSMKEIHAAPPIFQGPLVFYFGATETVLPEWAYRFWKKHMEKDQ